jgi:hypothetical protein
MSDTDQEQPQVIPLRIDWHFPEGLQTYPIIVDDGEYVVTELKYHMHGEGSTIPEAIEAFRRIFLGYLDILSEEEDNLSSYLYEQLEYLRSAIRTE